MGSPPPLHSFESHSVRPAQERHIPLSTLSHMKFLGYLVTQDAQRPLNLFELFPLLVCTQLSFPPGIHGIWGPGLLAWTPLGIFVRS